MNDITFKLHITVKKEEFERILEELQRVIQANKDVVPLAMVEWQAEKGTR